MRWAIEPLVELPIGKTFALPTSNGRDSTLGRWINTHDLTVSFAGGLRFWVWDDLASVSVYFSQPLTNATGFIHVRGSNFEYPVSSVRRPYPGFSLGLLGDTLWLGFDYQELINGETAGHIDSNFGPSALVSRSWSMTVGLATVNTVRWGLGTAASKAESDKRTKAAEDQIEVATKAASDATQATTDATKATGEATNAAMKATAAKIAETNAANAQDGAGDNTAAAAAITAKEAKDDAQKAIDKAKSNVLIAQAMINTAKAQIARAREKAAGSDLGEQKRKNIEDADRAVEDAETKVKAAAKIVDEILTDA
jgi:hypothetical protein